MIRENFPTKEGHTEGGYSDGYMFRIDFLGKTDQDSVDMIRAFLDKHGYQDVPLPIAERLWWDYFQPDEYGNSGRFIWHPIRILPSRFGETGLALFIHNEKDPEHKETWNLFVKND